MKRNVVPDALLCAPITIVLFGKSFLNDRRLHVGCYTISDICWAPVAGPFLPFNENNANVSTKPRFNAHRLTCTFPVNRLTPNVRFHCVRTDIEIRQEERPRSVRVLQNGNATESAKNVAAVVAITTITVIVYVSCK